MRQKLSIVVGWPSLWPFVLLALLAACPAWGQAGEPVTVRNGGFEQGGQGWGVKGQGGVVDDTAHTGRRSLRLDRGHALQRPTADQLSPIEPGHDYRLSIWIRTEDVSEHGATLMAVCRSAGEGNGTKWLGGWLEGSAPRFVHDNGASPAIIATGGTHDWKQFETFIPASQLHDKTRYLSIYLRHDAHKKDTTGTAWFDDLTIEKLPKGTAPETAGPMLRNGGFEQGRAGWGGPGGELVSDTATEGTHSMRVEQKFVFQQKIPVEGGKHYRISMKIKSDGASENAGYVQMSFRGPRVNPGWRGPVKMDLHHPENALFITGGTHDWKTFEAVIKAPNRAKQMLLYLRKSGGDGAVYYDDVSIEPTDDPVTEPAELREKGMAPPEPLLSDTDFARPELVNTGFEQGAKGWLFKGAVALARDTAAQGEASLKLYNGHAVQGLRVQPKQNYRVTVWTRAEAAAGDTVSVRLRYRGPRRPRDRFEGPVPVTSDRRKRPGAIAAGGTHDWRERSVVVRVPDDANQMLVYLSKSVDDGTAWLDGLRIEPTDEPALTRERYRAQRIEALLRPGASPEAARTARGKALAAAKEPTPETLTLADNGEANYTIHVGSADDPVELYAAEELAKYLGEISGASFAPVAHDASPSSGPLLVVGRQNELTDQLCPDIDYTALGEDGFVIRTAGPHVVIAGNTPRGTLYGVYWLLDRKLGVRWLSPAYTHVPRRDTLTLDAPDMRQAPRFTYREIFSRDTDAPWYRQHNLLNGRSHHRENLPAPDGIDTWSDYWPTGGHNFHRIVSRKKYGKEHPDWFTGGQLAMMNENVRRIAAERLTKIIDKRKDHAYGFSQQDRGWAADAESKAFAKQHGDTLAAPLIDMVSDIGARVREQVPEARIATLAYHWSFPAPTGLDVPPYVLITVAPIEANFAYPHQHAKNAPIGDHIAQWADIAEHIVVWDYITNFGGYIQPHPNLGAMSRSIQWLAEHEAIQGYFGQGAYGSTGVPFAPLRAWVAARLLWDPDQDHDALVDEFVEHYYGDAAPYIREYITLLHDAVRETDTPLTIRTQVTAPFLSFEVMHEADRLMERAAEAVRDQPGFQRRVRKTRLGVDYVILLRRAAFAHAAQQRDLDWQVNAEQRIERFQRDARRAGISKFGEGVGSLASLVQTMSINRRVAAPPKLANGLSDDAWLDFQDLDLRRYGHTSVVEDEKASDGVAIRMPGNVGVWGVQMRLDNLPPEGRWKLHVAVRIDAGEGAGDDTALQLGVYPPMANARRPSVADLADGEYRLLELPGGPYRHDPGESLWLAPPNSRAIAAMYVDRVIAVRTDE
ncbi:MAG: DUF4838 domain-containing protein [Phycisphaeraceae bacterium]